MIISKRKLKSILYNSVFDTDKEFRSSLRSFYAYDKFMDHLQNIYSNLLKELKL